MESNEALENRGKTFLRERIEEIRRRILQVEDDRMRLKTMMQFFTLSPSQQAAEIMIENNKVQAEMEELKVLMHRRESEKEKTEPANKKLKYNNTTVNPYFESDCEFLEPTSVRHESESSLVHCQYGCSRGMEIRRLFDLDAPSDHALGWFYFYNL